jgi:indolepyruvate ferredoxin oxidoreductase beta subunit
LHKTDIFLAGIGGQGVLLASEIISQAALSAGYDVKKSEVHGMSQRGGTVTSCVRLGRKVFSPLIEMGKADVLISLHPEEGERYRNYLRRGGFFLEPSGDIAKRLKNPRTWNIVAVGMLSAHLSIAASIWMDAIAASVPEKYLEENKEAFLMGRSLCSQKQADVTPATEGRRKQ